MTATIETAATKATAAKSTDAKSKTNTASKKEYKTPAPSAPTAPQDSEKSLIYVRCRTCRGNRAKMLFHRIITMCVIFFVLYAIVLLAFIVNNGVTKAQMAYNELKENNTYLQEKYNILQKKMIILNNKPEESNNKPGEPNNKPEEPNNKPGEPNNKPEEPNNKPEEPNNKPEEPNNKPGEPSNKKKHFTPLILRGYNVDAEILRHLDSTSETESTTQTETRIQKEVTTEKESEEVTSNTDEKEKNQINEPALLSELDWYKKSLMKKIKLCIESPEKCQ